jgi:hypothetical protein
VPSETRWYRWDGADLVLDLLVQPRASRDGFAEVIGERLKVRLTSPPVEGAANAHLVEWLARQFGVPKSAVTLEAGAGSRRKRVRVHAPKTLPEGLSVRRG